MEPQQMVANLIRNAWNWGLREFAQQLGKSESDVWVQEKFQAFQRAAKELAQLGPEIIAVICSRPA